MDAEKSPSSGSTSQDDTTRSNSPADVPDGGLVAWSQVFAGHLVVFNCWGYISSFGFFQRYYVDELGIPSVKASWIGSMQMFLVFLLSAFSGRALDAGHFKITLMVGCFLQVFGAAMVSLATTFWQIFLAQGLCSGIGHGLVFSPVISLLSTYFSKRRVMAVSLAACGAATGGMIFPAIAYSCLQTIGFAWTVRVMALVVFANSVYIVFAMRTRIPPRKLAPFFEFKALKEVPFTLFTVGCFIELWGLYFAYFFINTYAREYFDYSQRDSLILLLVMNGIGVIGRVAPAILADRYCGPLLMFIPVVASSGVMLLCWIAVDSRTGLVVWAAFYGFFANAVQSQFPASASLFALKDLGKAGSRVGMIFTIVSISCLTGPPIGARLVALNGGNYLYAQIFGGVTMLVGACILTIAAHRLRKDG
ncbi:putative monocarboxylate permease [Macrophomina phaseolina]|uniref:Monocarboxylate permease n=1 Tax=Macrophomina phaseolina TaxID=35725 RepID=A0ABQ8GTB4_9PEZI|nr:putative monocarboxylate permease [Macrophomina phaseolina]